MAFLDWRDDPVITPENAAETLGDGAKGVHPTVATMAKLASRIADKLKAMAGTSDTPTPTPNQPTKNYSELKLTRLTDGSGLLDNLADNDQRVVDYLNGIDSQISTVFATGKIGAKVIAKPETTKLNQTARNYLFSVFGSIEDYLNQLVKMANSYGVLDPQTGQTTATVALNPPTELMFNSDFIAAINALWTTIESTLNDLQSYANVF